MKIERSWKLKLNALILSALDNGEFALRDLVQLLDGQIEHSLGPVKFSLAVHHALARMYAKGRINRQLIGRVAKYSACTGVAVEFVRSAPPAIVPPPIASMNAERLSAPLTHEPVQRTEERSAVNAALAYQIGRIESLTF
jgi:hypothetical protein